MSQLPKSYVTSTGEIISEKELAQFRNSKQRFLKRRYSNKDLSGVTVDENPMFKLPERAHQQFKTECDINHILKRYELTGTLPDAIVRNPSYGDFSTPHDFSQSMNTVVKAQQQFEGLSAKVRARFGNDPAQFLAFMHDPANQPEMVKLGLATPPATPPEDLTLKELKTMNKALKESLPKPKSNPQNE